MADAEVTWEILAKKPGGDHDSPYTFGNPRGGLTTIEQGLLLVMRGKVIDLKDPTARDLSSPAEGDIEPRVETTEAGVLVPVDPQPWITKMWGLDEPTES